MQADADFSLETADGGQVAVLTGDWTSMCLGDAGRRLEQALRGAGQCVFDLTGIGRCDTYGAHTIVRAAEGLSDTADLKARPETRRLLDLVAEAARRQKGPPRRRMRGVEALMDRLGRNVVKAGGDTMGTIAFIGRVIATAGRAVVRPSRIRWPS
ncbi:MAG TPA: ABC transporter permease, partial [Caulobacteraceae bacterium]